MIISMTGFGAAAGHTALGNFQVEIKSVNSRFLEFNFRLPPGIMKLELNLRQLISSKIRRGKVDVFIKWEEAEAAKPRIKINESAVKALFQQLRKINANLGLSEDIELTDLLSLPHCLEVEDFPVDEKRLWRDLQVLVKEALERCYQSRVREGQALKLQLSKSVKLLRQYNEEIAGLKDKLIENYKRRLREKVAEFNKNGEFKINEERLEAEVLFFADRADISEELTRIKAHLAAFKQYLAKAHKEQAGKALDFLSQEILREVNTIASKARDTEIAQRTLLMKNAVEEIREQIQNIE